MTILGDMMFIVQYSRPYWLYAVVISPMILMKSRGYFLSKNKAMFFPKKNHQTVCVNCVRFPAEPGRWTSWIHDCIANQPEGPCKKWTKFFAGERGYSILDTKRLVRISLYPCKIDLVHGVLQHGVPEPVGLDRTKSHGSSHLSWIRLTNGTGAGLW